MKKKILIVDDDSGIRDIFTIIFEKAGYSIEVMDNGNEVFQNKFIVPDIFLIDRLISGVDGLDICRYLKKKAETNKIPVVMISASPDIGPAALNAGADDFIEKPFDLSYLLKVVEKNLSKV